ncbi:MAG: ATP-binding cassette domain-containing protein [Rickettsiales bacterium]|jgi:ABC-type polysaccharide/polyol phosphate transport system ATPase subunit|nr:ATP-binding cassette domain-containing protein [Rickettsiales bacterium]
MSAQTIIVKNLSKKYTKFPDKNKFRFLFSLLREFFFDKVDDNLKGDEFWAFKDINFTLNKGEVFAILGSNGSGKSTLLKAIYGLIKTTSGEVGVNGRVDALINLGAGFNRDLSGRDNIKSHAALHNYPVGGIDDLVEQVVEFSELGDFIDSPVKNYSSGMYSRLGFSLITHMKPDVLIIDEVLAVGDVSFQNKCFVKMQELKTQGVTFLMVSHNQSQIAQFCDRALWLEKGEFKELGEAGEVLKKYIKYMNEKNFHVVDEVKKNGSKQSIYGPIHNFENQIQNVKVEIVGDNEEGQIITGGNAIVEYDFELLKSVENLNVSLNFSKEDGRLMSTINTVNGDLLRSIKSGKVKCRVYIEDLNLNPGIYVLVFVVQDNHRYIYRNIITKFNILASNDLVWGEINLKYKYQTF